MDVGSIKNSLNLGSPQSVVRLPASDAARKPGESAAYTATVAGEQPAEQAADQVKAVERTPEATREQVEDAVATIQEFVQSVRRSINFSVDDGSGRVVVKVTDAGSGDVIRQIPSEEALQLAENLAEVRSLLFKAEA